MRLLSSLLLGFTLVASAHSLSAAEAIPVPAIPDILGNLVDRVILPGYHDFSLATGQMQGTMETLCKEPSEEKLGDAQMAFDGIVATWSIVEPIKIGPAIEENRFERILFYPDRKGMGLRQVRTVLMKKDPGALNQADIKDKSVAVQGILALEYVLNGLDFEDLSSKKGEYRCQFGLSIAKNLDTLATEISDAWAKPDGVQASFRKPGPDNPLFHDDKEALFAVLGFIVHGLENIKDQRIAAFYEGADKLPMTRKALYYRSYNTMPSIAANLEGLLRIWSESGMKELLQGDAKPIGGNADFNFTSAINAAVAMDLPLDEALVDDTQKGKLAFLILTLKEQIKLLDADYGKAVGLGAGFSFSDGD
jgi:uncharacterized protein